MVGNIIGGWKVKELTSINFSVSPKQARSVCCSCPARLNEQLRQSPANPMSSSSSFSTAVELSSMALENLGLDVSVCSSACAASSVADDWQCRRISSRRVMMGAHLDYTDGDVDG
jgi:hypothetical protein